MDSLGILAALDRIPKQRPDLTIPGVHAWFEGGAFYIAHIEDCATCSGTGTVEACIYGHTGNCPCSKYEQACPEDSCINGRIDHDGGCGTCSECQTLQKVADALDVLADAMAELSPATEDRPTPYELHQEGMDAK